MPENCFFQNFLFMTQAMAAQLEAARNVLTSKVGTRDAASFVASTELVRFLLKAEWTKRADSEKAFCASSGSESSCWRLPTK